MLFNERYEVLAPLYDELEDNRLTYNVKVGQMHSL